MPFNIARQLSSTVRRLRRGPLTDSRLFPRLGTGQTDGTNQIISIQQKRAHLAY
jgi:hypothetical protein